MKWSHKNPSVADLCSLPESLTQSNGRGVALWVIMREMEKDNTPGFTALFLILLTNKHNPSHVGNVVWVCSADGVLLFPW